MVHSCFLCGNRKSDEKLSFFHFPRRKEERERWISLCRPYVNLDLLKVTRNTRICQRHFSPHSIHCKRERTRLRYRAAPTIFFEKRISYRKCVPLSECDNEFDGEALHQNHFLMNGIPNDGEEAEEAHPKYYDAASHPDVSDFENSLDCVTVDTADILCVPASEFVEVQMDSDSHLINENDIENISIPPENDAGIDDVEIQSTDCLIDEPCSPNCIVISSDDESSDESSASESNDSVHDDHTYCEPLPKRHQSPQNSSNNSQQPTVLPNDGDSAHTYCEPPPRINQSPQNSSNNSQLTILPNDDDSAHTYGKPPPRSHRSLQNSFNNRQQPAVLPNDGESAHIDVMRVSLAHYKNNTRILQSRLRIATKKLENLEHAIHELGVANKISKNDMEKLLCHINPVH